MTSEDFINGQLLLIDKPLNWTSFQVVNKLRWAIKKKFNLKKIKVGHAGTLDPLARGLLIICTGKFTKQIDSYQAQVKEYTGAFYIGATRPSYDLETEIDATFDTAHISPDLIKNTRLKFIGELYQKPPMFSAIKKDGKRLYDLARAGQTTTIVPRKINISNFEISNIEMPLVYFKVVCSKGTYIRSLAYDFGLALGSGAYLAELTRTKIGDFKIENAQSIEEFLQSINF